LSGSAFAHVWIVMSSEIQSKNEICVDAYMTSSLRCSAEYSSFVKDNNPLSFSLTNI
jgi:hypothetical protein